MILPSQNCSFDHAWDTPCPTSLFACERARPAPTYPNDNNRADEFLRCPLAFTGQGAFSFWVDDRGPPGPSRRHEIRTRSLASRNGVRSPTRRFVGSRAPGRQRGGRRAHVSATVPNPLGPACGYSVALLFAIGGRERQRLKSNPAQTTRYASTCEPSQAGQPATTRVHVRIRAGARSKRQRNFPVQKQPTNFPAPHPDG